VTPVPDPDRPEEPASARVETFECSMCRRQTPATQSLVMGGRRLCFGCASGWFEDEE